MRFWDSLAVIPLCLEEPASEKVRSLVEKGPLNLKHGPARREGRCAQKR
jgi:hypothetical protein